MWNYSNPRPQHQYSSPSSSRDCTEWKTSGAALYTFIRSTCSDSGICPIRASVQNQLDNRRTPVSQATVSGKIWMGLKITRAKMRTRKRKINHSQTQKKK